MTSDDPTASSPASPEDEYVTEMLASLRDTAPIPADVSARLDAALSRERLESDDGVRDVDELAQRRDSRGTGRSWLIGLGAAAALVVAIPIGVTLLHDSTPTTAVTADSAPGVQFRATPSADTRAISAVTATGTAYTAGSLRSQVLTLLAERRGLTSQSAGGPVAQATDLATPEAAKIAVGTFASDASQLAQCLDALTAGTQMVGTSPQAIDAASYAGSPAVVVVYLYPGLGPFPHWHVWVVNPTCSDPGRLLLSTSFTSAEAVVPVPTSTP